MCFRFQKGAPTYGGTSTTCFIRDNDGNNYNDDDKNDGGADGGGMTKQSQRPLSPFT